MVIPQIKIEELNRTLWAQAPVENKQAALQELEAVLSNAQNRPQRELRTFNDRPYAGFVHSEYPDLLFIHDNIIAFKAPDEAVKTIAHEGRHAYQMDCIDFPERHVDEDKELIEQWRENFSPGNYITDEMSESEYRKQPVEKDAYSYEKHIHKAVYSIEKQTEVKMNSEHQSTSQGTSNIKPATRSTLGMSDSGIIGTPLRTRLETHEMNYRSTGTPVAIALTEQQARLILASEYPNDRQAQNAALAAMKNEGKPVEIMEARADLDYDQKGFYYATVDQADQSAVEQHVRDLEANAKSQPQKPSPERGDFEHE